MIAFTSDFIQKLVFRYHYGEDTTMDGYVRFTLSKAPAENWTDDGRVKNILKGKENSLVDSC